MAGLNITLTRFFGLSVAIHAAVFYYLILIQRSALTPRSEPPPIAVSLLPPGEKEPSAAAPAATELSKTPATIAKTETRNPAKGDARSGDSKTRKRPRSGTTEKSPAAMARNAAAERIIDDAVTAMPVPKTAATQPELPLEKSIVAERQ